MNTVFVAGSITIRALADEVLERLDNIVRKELHVLVGDADGADTAIQRHLQKAGARAVTVYCSGDRPRNNIGQWHVHCVETSHAPGSRAFFTAKDLAMARAADVGLMVWDAKSTGTLSNVFELLARGRKSVVFVQREQTFVTVGNLVQLDALLSRMSAADRQKADGKMRLEAKLASLRSDAGGLAPH
jgi:hypothetical protein